MEEYIQALGEVYIQALAVEAVYIQVEVCKLAQVVVVVHCHLRGWVSLNHRLLESLK